MPEISVSLNETVITAAVTNPAAMSASIASEPITASLEDGIDINASISSTPVTATLVNGGTVAITVTDTPVTVSLVAGFGDVVGPASAVDSNFVAFNTTTGKLIKDSGYSPSSFELADATIIKSGNASWVDLTDGGETDLHSHAASGGDISGTGVVGQVAEFVTDTKTLQAAKLIAPSTHILTLTNAAAATLALNITSGKTLTLTAADNYTLTIPATGTAALLGTANVFTAVQKINVNSTTALVVEQDGVKDNVLVVDTTNGRIGSGVGSLSAVMDIQGNSETSYWATTFSDAQSTQNVYRRARGTQSSPSAILSNDSLGSLSFRGYNGSSFTSSRGFVDFRANENWSAVANGTRMLFSITPNGSTTLLEVLRFINGIGVFNENSADYDFRFEGDTDANLLYLNAGTNRIGVGTTTPASRFHVDGISDEIQFVVQGHSTQTTNLQEWQNSSGVVLFYIEPDGEIVIPQDSKAIKFGAGVDASIYYDGTNLIVNPKVVGTGFLSLLGDLSIVDEDIILGTTTGSKIGTATTQKLAFWNATPIVQPTTAVAAATFAANTSGIANDTATFDGYTIGQIVKALRNEGLLA